MSHLETGSKPLTEEERAVRKHQLRTFIETVNERAQYIRQQATALANKQPGAPYTIEVGFKYPTDKSGNFIAEMTFKSATKNLLLVINWDGSVLTVGDTQYDLATLDISVAKIEPNRVLPEVTSANTAAPALIRTTAKASQPKQLAAKGGDDTSPVEAAPRRTITPLPIAAQVAREVGVTSKGKGYQGWDTARSLRVDDGEDKGMPLWRWFANHLHRGR